jgi:hypothetical protein
VRITCTIGLLTILVLKSDLLIGKSSAQDRRMRRVCRHGDTGLHRQCIEGQCCLSTHVILAADSSGGKS